MENEHYEPDPYKPYGFCGYLSLLQKDGTTKLFAINSGYTSTYGAKTLIFEPLESVTTPVPEATS